MWQPLTESDIALAIADGNLYESSSIDVKREVGDSPSSRRETAKDIASFATYGGALLIGVSENKKARRFELAPIALSDAVERIEQIAATRVDPPLFVRVREIPSEQGPDVGYLWVEIPASGQAPHMVDGVYYGRGERTTRKLTDSEVDELHRLRVRRANIADDALDEQILRDPIPEVKREHGHLYLVAEPLNASAGQARALTRASNNSEMMELIARVENRLSREMLEWAPRLTSAHYFSNRSRGAGMSNVESTAEKTTFASLEDRLVDLEVHENGGIRVLCCRLTIRRNPESPNEVSDGLLVAYALRIAHLAADVAAACDYRGGWAFGLHASGMQGAPSYLLSRDWAARASPYDAATYREVVQASSVEVAEQPERVATRLVAPFLRGLGSAKFFSAVLDAEEL